MREPSGPTPSPPSAALFTLACVAFVSDAQAANLQAPPGAPAWAHFGADALLFLHIGGGSVGILSGAVTLLARKGARLHRAAGTVFFGSMLITYAIGAGVAPFLPEEQRTNFIAGILALYLLISGWMTAQRPQTTAGAPQIIGLLMALLIVGAGGLFMYMGATNGTGTVDGAPPQAFILFTVAGTLAAAGELNVIVRGSISGPARIARHLWRMCFSLFIAAGSFFLGQQKFFPEWVRDSLLPVALAFAPVAAMLFWLVRVRLPNKIKAA